MRLHFVFEDTRALDAAGRGAQSKRVAMIELSTLDEHGEYMDTKDTKDTKARILVIDDDPWFRNLLDSHLSTAGYTVQMAEGAVDGGKVLLRSKFDLVICGVNRSLVSGLELRSLLRASAETASIPVIVVTARTDRDAILEAEKLGAAAYLSKPVQTEYLLETVELCLRRSRGISDSRAHRDGLLAAGGAQPFVLLEDDVYDLTPKGRKELDAGGTALSPSELKLLVLIDGKSTVGETAVRAAALAFGNEAVLYIVRRLAEDGFIELVKDAGGSLDFVDFFSGNKPRAPSAAATAEAEKASVATTLLLQQRGYFVRIARRPGTMRGPAPAHAPSILVVEDEFVLSNMLKHVLEAGGFGVRTAKNRAQIAAELRRTPLPDLVLLDVMLPDVDGFEVLLKIRQHPVMHSMAVMMLTAQATREAVLKGLAGGANGYITKPFEIPALVTAVQAVLGLTESGS